eukprot:3757538-Rhodomonas_salina.2
MALPCGMRCPVLTEHRLLPCNARRSVLKMYRKHQAAMRYPILRQRVVLHPQPISLNRSGTPPYLPLAPQCDGC